MKRFRIKKEDMVKVLRGKDAGKTGKVTQVLPALEKVVVDGANTMVKHIRSPRKGEKGQRIEFFAPLHISKVALLCPKCNKPTRVGYQIIKGEDSVTHKSRRCLRCQETFQ